MLSKGSLTVLPVVTDNVAYNLEMQPASKAASGSSGQTNYLYVSPNLVFNPATNQLVFNTSVVFGGTATYANGSPVGSGTNATVNTANATVNTATATVNTAAAYAFTNSDPAMNVPTLVCQSGAPARQTDSFGFSSRRPLTFIFDISISFSIFRQITKPTTRYYERRRRTRLYIRSIYLFLRHSPRFSA